MKLKRQDPIVFLLEKTSAIALEAMASKMSRFASPFQQSRQRQARSPKLDIQLNTQLLLAAPLTNFVFLNAIAIWNWVDSFRYSYRSHLSHHKTNLSYKNFLTNFSGMKQRRVVFSLPCPPCPLCLPCSFVLWQFPQLPAPFLNHLSGSLPATI